VSWRPFKNKKQIPKFWTGQEWAEKEEEKFPFLLKLRFTSDFKSSPSEAPFIKAIFCSIIFGAKTFHQQVILAVSN
jgi:hypothetical protein